MANILLLTQDQSHAAFTNTKAALESLGHTVYKSSSASHANLDAAFNGIAGVADLICTVRPAKNNDVYNWVFSRWEQGVPVLIGGPESGTVDATHLATTMGLATSSTTESAFNSDKMYLSGTDWGDSELFEGVAHNGEAVTVTTVSEGFAKWLTGLNGPVGMTLGTATNDTAYMVQVDKGDAVLSSPNGVSVAPARAVFIGWIYLTPYTEIGEALIGNSVDWLISEPVLPIEVDVAVASAEMPDPDIETLSSPSFAATPATASAEMLSADVEALSGMHVSHAATTASANGSMTDPTMTGGSFEATVIDVQATAVDIARVRSYATYKDLVMAQPGDKMHIAAPSEDFGVLGEVYGSIPNWPVHNAYGYGIAKPGIEGLGARGYRTYGATSGTPAAQGMTDLTFWYKQDSPGTYPSIGYPEQARPIIMEQRFDGWGDYDRSAWFKVSISPVHPHVGTGGIRVEYYDPNFNGRRETLFYPMPGGFNPNEWYFVSVVTSDDPDIGGIRINGVLVCPVPKPVAGRTADRPEFGANASHPINTVDELTYGKVTAEHLQARYEFLKQNSMQSGSVATAAATMLDPTMSFTSNAKHSALAATTTALMPTPEVRAISGVAVWPEVMTASADMPQVKAPNAYTFADVMTVTGHTGDGWFKSNRIVTVDPAGANGELLTGSVEVWSNITVNATPAEMRTAWINNPLEVNEDILDPYWNRVTRKAGVNLPPNAGRWMRFNERSGSTVHLYDPRTGQKSLHSAARKDLEGSFIRGVPGPNGKRATHIENAGLHWEIDDLHTMQDPRMRREVSIEFTFRIEPNHTGRMDIFNGYVADSVDKWTGEKRPVSMNVSIQDGRLHYRYGAGGLSRTRVDDGEFHHVVITRPYSRNTYDRAKLYVYIDGVLDRAYLAYENIDSGVGDSRRAAAPIIPDHYFGQDTGYPFTGDFLDFIWREKDLNSSQIAELYYDMMGITPTRAGIAEATGEMGNHKVESNMKRMLVLSFNNADQPDDTFGKLATRKDPVQYTPVLVHGFGTDTDVGNFRTTYQYVWQAARGDAYWEMLRDTGVIDESHPYNTKSFYDENSGDQRFIDIHRDVNLDNFDVIFIQGYNNPALNSQASVKAYEDFFESINKAVVDGRKVLVTDPYLAHDLGWVEDIEKVPVMRSGANDVRSYDVMPLNGGPAVRPADGSKPVLGQGIEYHALGFFIYNTYRHDFHHNNGFRVVNEIPGLTDLPSWEVEELYFRDRTETFPDNMAYYDHGYILSNRTGLDYGWEVKFENGDKYARSKGHDGRGLRAGDEFYDYTWLSQGMIPIKRGSLSSAGLYARSHRIYETWSVKQLNVGTPVATFRSTLHDDFGNEVANPYRDHIRNAVIRPGDRLPDGRKVKGYVYMDFSMKPAMHFLAGMGIPRQWSPPAGVGPDGKTGDPNKAEIRDNNTALKWETYRTEKFDYMFLGRTQTSGGENFESTSYTVSYSNQNGQQIPTFIPVVTSWPRPQRRGEMWAVRPVPHLTWMSRGLAWLTTLDYVETEYANTAALSALANGKMNDPAVATEFDRTVSAGPAQAYGDIVAPVETQVKEVRAFATAATATGEMTGLTGGYVAEVSDGWADMYQNIHRPLDIEEVLFFTVHMHRNNIYLRLEEN